MSTPISKNFKLEEFAVSASHPELVVPVPVTKVGRVVKLVITILQPARDKWGHPFRILSGYRSDALNKAAGGSPTSQHRMAEAADVTTTDTRGLFVYLMSANLPLGQVIYYPAQNFVHIALPGATYTKPTFFVSKRSKVYIRVNASSRLAELGV